jgi:hypothetical protein
LIVIPRRKALATVRATQGGDFLDGEVDPTHHAESKMPAASTPLPRSACAQGEENMSKLAFGVAQALALLLTIPATLSAADSPKKDDSRRERLRKEILEQRGFDATRWGEDVRNPFTDLTAEGKAKLKAEGVEVDRLAKLKAVLITGNYCGANSKTFVNRDPDTILILGNGFVTHGDVWSLGPVLGVENAHLMGRLTGADLVWFVERAWPRMRTRGAPHLAAMTSPLPHDPKTKGELRRGDYGWRRPDNFLKPVPVRAGAPLPPLAAADAEKKRKDLRDLVLSHGGEDVADWCDEVVNPFHSLSKKGRAKLAARGLDAARLGKCKAVFLTGNYCGSAMRNFVNRDPNTVLIIGKEFITHGAVFSVGPVLAVENAHFMGDVYGADLIWFVDRSLASGRTVGLPVILAPTHSVRYVVTDDIWYGDYGWNRPPDFLHPAPITLTDKEMDVLWVELDGDDAGRVTRTARKLIAAEKYFLPYLKQRLRMPPRPAGGVVDRLLDDLDSDQFRTRQEATRELERLGLLVEPQLRLMLQTNPNLEVRRRIEQILDGFKSEQKRIRRALQALR